MSAPVTDPIDEQVLPTAYKGTRGAVLVALKRAGALTSRRLGEQLGLSANGVRHHLRELESEGLIGYRRERRGVGAPTFTWHLEASGEALFPQRYKEVLTEVLDCVAALAGRQAVVDAIETRFVELARGLRSELEGAPPSRRREVVRRALAAGGFMAEWQPELLGFRLTEHHCAIRAVAERFPEICAAEARFLQEVLGAQVERETHMLDGCLACEYKVHFPDGDESPEQTHRDGSVPEETQ
jgi:DeoR family transcriptional regulator, suf operon transcriptional repressor